jgi:hypothetical protein
MLGKQVVGGGHCLEYIKLVWFSTGNMRVYPSNKEERKHVKKSVSNKPRVHPLESIPSHHEKNIFRKKYSANRKK